MFVGCQPELLARIVRRDERAIYFGERLILSRTTYSSGALHFRRIRTRTYFISSIGFQQQQQQLAPPRHVAYLYISLGSMLPSLTVTDAYG